MVGDKMQIIYIKWRDAYYDDTLCNIDKVHNGNGYILETVGFYLGTENGYICIATENKAQGNQVQYRHYIPTINIIKKRFFTV